MSAASVSPHPMRRSSRIRWQMPLRITSLDSNTTFSEICETLVVNVHGAGVRSPSALVIATRVRLEAADHRTTTGWITDLEPLGHHPDWWLLGIALEQPSNFWGVPNPPDNWAGHLAPIAAPPPQDPERKFSVWPGAYGPPVRTPAPSSLTLVSGKTTPAQRPAPAAQVAPQAPPRDSGDPASLLERLQTDLERRTEEHWRRLRGELEPQLLASTRGLQQQIEESFAAWRVERTAVEGKLQELLGVRDEVSTRLESIASFLRAQSAPLREEILAEARAQVDRLICDFKEQMRGERQAAESSLTAAIEQQLGTKTDALLQQLRDRSAESVGGLASTAIDRLERQLQARLDAAGDKLQQHLLAEIEQRQQGASQAIAVHIEELRASEAGFRDRIRQLSDELSSQAERSLAQLRVQVQELGEQHEAELAARAQQRHAAAEAGLQAAAGEALAATRQALQSDVQHQQQEMAVSRQSLLTEIDKLHLRAQQMEAHLAEVREAREYVESLARMLPDTIEHAVREPVAAAIARISGPVQQQFIEQAQTEIATLEQQARHMAELQDLLSQREQQLREVLAQNQTEAIGLLRQQAADTAAALQEQLRIHFEEGRKQFEQAQASALRQLETLQGSADHLTSLVDLELQQHADALLEETTAEAERRMQAASEAVREEHRQKTQADTVAILQGKLQQDADALVAKTLAAAGERLQNATAAMHRDQVARTQAELDRLLAAVVQQASNAGSELRHTIDSLQQDLAQTKLDSADIRRQVEQAQSLLAQQTSQFQSTLHDAFLQATAEIKGRIHQAVEMAEEPLERRSRDIQSQLTVAAQHLAEELQKQFSAARGRLQEAATASESHAEQALQERLAHATEAFRQDADNLARRSMERWQAAIGETLAEIPRLLGDKLRPDSH